MGLFVMEKYFYNNSFGWQIDDFDIGLNLD